MEKEVKSKVVLFVLLIGILSVIAPAVVREQSAFAGSIIGWGSQVVSGDLSEGFTAISAGGYHSLGLKQDGSIVAWRQ